MLDLGARYPGQVVTTDPAYPQGKARNRVGVGDSSGTPYEADLVNDLHGAHQALVAEGAVTPSGNPDQVGASDVVTATKNIADARIAASGRVTAASARYTISGTGVSYTSNFTLAQDFADANYSLASNVITVAAAGRYEISVLMSASRSDTSNPCSVLVELIANGQWQLGAVRFTATPAHEVMFSGTITVDLAAAATINLRSGSVSGTMSVGSTTKRLSVVRVS